MLSLLLMLAPVLTAAGSVPMMVSVDARASTAPAQMPCHPSEVQPMQAGEIGQQDSCPHCTGDAPASQCHCCGYAAPAGLSVSTGISPDHHPGGAPLRPATADPLPETQGDRLYRPPIAHS